MAASSPELPNVGDTVAERFELRRVLGEGGMGVVYEAFDRKRKGPCALKILFPHYCNEPQIIARFDREAKIAAKLKGPNVARVFEVGALPNALRYIAMELLVGKTLEAELAGGRLPISRAIDIVVQTARAMAEAHALGVVHRDIKPENLFLLPSDKGAPVVKVLDFGISRLVQNNEKLTTDFSPLGTALYMSPEQIEAPSRVDERTDVWSLGVVLYEAVTGRPPFEGEGTGVLVSIATRPVPPPSTVARDLPSGLEDVMMHALEKSPDARFQSMEEFARALEPFLGRPKRRKRSPVIAVGVTVALAAAIAALVSTYDLQNARHLVDDLTSTSPASSTSSTAAFSVPSSKPSTSSSVTKRTPPARSAHPPQHAPSAHR